MYHHYYGFRLYEVQFWSTPRLPPASRFMFNVRDNCVKPFRDWLFYRFLEFIGCAVTLSPSFVLLEKSSSFHPSSKQFHSPTISVIVYAQATTTYSQLSPFLAPRMKMIRIDCNRKVLLSLYINSYNTLSSTMGPHIWTHSSTPRKMHLFALSMMPFVLVPHPACALTQEYHYFIAADSLSPLSPSRSYRNSYSSVWPPDSLTSPLLNAKSKHHPRLNLEGTFFHQIRFHCLPPIIPASSHASSHLPSSFFSSPILPGLLHLPLSSVHCDSKSPTPFTDRRIVTPTGLNAETESVSRTI